MYGKTLADFPGRFEVFHDALVGMSPVDVELGFRKALQTLTEFPVPSQIIELARVERKRLRDAEQQSGQRSEWALDEAKKAERFLPPGQEPTEEEKQAERERLRAEFQGMLSRSKLKGIEV